MTDLLQDASEQELHEAMIRPISTLPVKSIIDQELANCRELHDIRFKNIEREIEKIVESIDKTEIRNEKFYSEIRLAIIDLTKTTEKLQAIGRGLYISMAVVAFVLLLLDRLIK